MREKRNLLLINQSKKGVLYPFPKNFELPPSVTVGEHEIEFFKTDRVKTIGAEACPIYAEKNLNFSLDEVADQRVEVEPSVEEPEQPITDAHDELAEIIASGNDYEDVLNAVIDWHNRNLIRRI